MESGQITYQNNLQSPAPPPTSDITNKSLHISDLLFSGGGLWGAKDNCKFLIFFVTKYATSKTINP
jgi:hypothetical protein